MTQHSLKNSQTDLKLLSVGWFPPVYLSLGEVFPRGYLDRLLYTPFMPVHKMKKSVCIKLNNETTQIVKF